MPIILDPSSRRRLDATRRGLLYRRQPAIDQLEIDELADRWRELRPAAARRDEDLDLVRGDGKPDGTVAPRWLCHLFGLRHRCAHILLRWPRPDGATPMLLQVRSFTKSSYPGHLDISVGGHVPAGVSPMKTAVVEMQEELGLRREHLEDRSLVRLTGFESYIAKIGEVWHDREWCDLFTATLCAGALEAVCFPDGEVAGVRLCADAEAIQLGRSQCPVAPGLAHSLPHCLTAP